METSLQDGGNQPALETYTAQKTRPHAGFFVALFHFDSPDSLHAWQAESRRNGADVYVEIDACQVIGMPVVPFRRPEPATRIQRAVTILELAGVRADFDQGVTDEGEPWMVVCSPGSADVLVHVAVISDEIVVHAHNEAEHKIISLLAGKF